MGQTHQIQPIQPTKPAKPAKPAKQTLPSNYRKPTTTPKKYDEEQQLLNLDTCVGDWKQMLMLGDWALLQILWLNYCQIDDTDVELIGSMEWPNLQKLIIGANKISAVGLKQLLSPEFPKLKQLNLNFNNIGCAGINILTKAELPQLEKLGLSYCRLGNEAVKQATKGQWPLLSKLWIEGNSISYDGCLAATVLGNWRCLDAISIWSIEKIEPIIFFSFLTSNWPETFTLKYTFRSLVMSSEIQKILVHRFNHSTMII